MYRAKAIAYFALSLVLCALAQSPDDGAHPPWIVALLAFGAATAGLQAIRQLRLHRYYEGWRTRLVIDAPRFGARRR